MVMFAQALELDWYGFCDTTAFVMTSSCYRTERRLVTTRYATRCAQPMPLNIRCVSVAPILNKYMSNKDSRSQLNMYRYGWLSVIVDMILIT